MWKLILQKLHCLSDYLGRKIQVRCNYLFCGGSYMANTGPKIREAQSGDYEFIVHLMYSGYENINSIKIKNFWMNHG